MSPTGNCDDWKWLLFWVMGRANCPVQWFVTARYASSPSQSSCQHAPWTYIEYDVLCLSIALTVVNNDSDDVQTKISFDENYSFSISRLRNTRTRPGTPWELFIVHMWDRNIGSIVFPLINNKILLQGKILQEAYDFE